MNNKLLEIKNLHISYGQEKALNGLNLEFSKGSICAFVGSNGAGKTTTFSAIANFIYPDKGEIIIAGSPLKQYRQNGGLIGLLPQDVSFYNNRTIFSQLLFLAKLSGLTSAMAFQEVQWSLEVVGLENKKDHYPSQLSHGMKVRLGIAQAILGHPKLVLLDEPTSGLDPLRREQFYDLINSLKSKISFIISSHQLRELESLCDHVCIIEKGKLIVSDTMKNFLSTDQHLFYKTSQSTEVFRTELKNRFQEFKFNFNSNKKAFTVFPNNKNTPLKIINKEIISWLLKKDIDIIKFNQESSLTSQYLKQFKKTDHE